MTKYKIGRLDYEVSLLPGDRFNLTYTDLGGTDLLHTECITKKMACTHYAVLSTPFSMGMIIGTDELEAFMEESFPGCGVGENDPIL
jgi:hypothetical protein